MTGEKGKIFEAIKVSLNVFTPIGFFLMAAYFEMPLIWAFTVIVAIFFHEYGHYHFMKKYGYDKTHLFIVLPFFGFVTGEKSNESASELTDVLLAGPLPGIFFGAVISLSGFILDDELLQLSGSVFLFFNGFNLLPLYPLDGGRFVVCLLGIEKRGFVIYLSASVVATMLLIFYFEMYPLAIIVILQVFILVSILLRKWDNNPPENDMSVKRKLIYAMVYIIAWAVVSVTIFL